MTRRDPIRVALCITTTLAIALAAGWAAGPCAAQGMLSEHAVVAQTIAGTTITIE